jgi:hypothetical protein
MSSIWDVPPRIIVLYCMITVFYCLTHTGFLQWGVCCTAELCIYYILCIDIPSTNTLLHHKRAYKVIVFLHSSVCFLNEWFLCSEMDFHFCIILVYILDIAEFSYWLPIFCSTKEISWPTPKTHQVLAHDPYGPFLCCSIIKYFQSAW